MAIKRPPAIQRIRSGETKRRSMSAKSTAIADVETRAADAAKNTVHLDFASEAKQKVASWVLSPNSATNIAKKVVKKSFQSIYQRFPILWKIPILMMDVFWLEIVGFYDPEGIRSRIT